jgi:hypothetical protein
MNIERTLVAELRQRLAADIFQSKEAVAALIELPIKQPCDVRMRKKRQR